mmetsp:Transcript_5877/g.12027  ORF Transcript_5877/g.12027 Transcript_5877/m.12027 type:complete len:306 (+) Transcript_5877:212-1129(+)
MRSNIFFHGGLDTLGLHRRQGLGKCILEDGVQTNVAVDIVHIQPNIGVRLGRLGQLLQAIPLWIIGSNSLSGFCGSHAVPAPHGRYQSQTVDTRTRLESVSDRGDNEFRLSTGTVVAVPSNGVLQDWVGETFGNESPVFRQVSIGHRRDGRNDLVAFQSIQKGSNRRVFHGFVDVFDTQQSRGIAERCVPTVENTNLHGFKRFDVLDNGNVFECFPCRPTEGEGVFDDPLSEGFTKDGSLIFVTIRFLDKSLGSIGTSWGDTIHHAAGEWNFFSNPFRHFVSVHGLGQTHHDRLGDLAVVRHVVT